MATYRQIQKEVMATAGFIPQTSWIAHVLSDQGSTTGLAANRNDPNVRLKPCPADKRPAIEAAIAKLSGL